jgi:aspartate aminotransferase-like enzyme
MVAVSSRAWQKIKGNKAPRFYFDLQKHKEFFDKGEPPWTPPVSVAFALDVAIDLYQREGPRNVGRVTRATPTRFIKPLRRSGCRSSRVTACIRSP